MITLKCVGRALAGAAMFGATAGVTAFGGEPADKSQKIVCKTSQQTGTRFVSKTCHTKEVWEQIEEASKRQAREMIDKPIFETRREGGRGG